MLFLKFLDQASPVVPPRVRLYSAPGDRYTSYHVFRGTGYHLPSGMSKSIESPAGCLLSSRVQNVWRMWRRNKSNHFLGGFGWSGHSSSESARHSPRRAKFPMNVPSGETRSAIVMTRRYNRTEFNLWRRSFDILGLSMKASIIDSSCSRCSLGVHASSILSDVDGCQTTN